MSRPNATLNGAPVFALLSLIHPDDGTIEFIVDIYHGLKIVMYFDEHPPPHFCVQYASQSASFSIEECKRLRGNRGLERHEAKVKAWWKHHRELLVQTWNDSRPSDCPVGPIALKSA